MGISDEAYAQALEKHYHEHMVAKVKLAQEKERLRQEREKQMVGALTANVVSGGSVTVNATTTGQLHYSNNAYQQTTIGIKPLREEDLKHDAMQAPLSSLADMWTMRWDNQWVNEQEFMDDDFWRLALIRLLGANKLEKHNLVNQYHAVYRIIE